MPALSPDNANLGPVALAPHDRSSHVRWMRSRQQPEISARHPHLPEPKGTKPLMYRDVRLVRRAMPAIACCVMTVQTYGYQRSSVARPAPMQCHHIRWCANQDACSVGGTEPTWAHKKLSTSVIQHRSHADAAKSNMCLSLWRVLQPGHRVCSPKCQKPLPA
jgi:hypothetical protein